MDTVYHQRSCCSSRRGSSSQLIPSSLHRPEASIASLSPEILSAIFVLLKASYYIPPKFSFDKRSAPPWIYITEVCRQWYDVAFSCPALWNDIDTNKGSLAVTKLLELSKAAPITVSIKTYNWWRRQGFSEDISESIRRLDPHLSRAQKLNISISRGIINDIENIGCTSFPLVEELRLEGVSRDVETMSGNLVRNEMPRLRSVCLDQWIVPCESPVLSNLTHLTVGSHNPSPFQPSIGQLLAVLGRCPDLKELFLMNVGPVVREDSGNPLQPVALRSLVHLVLEMDALQCSAFTSYVELPSEEQLTWNIVCHIVDNNLPNILIPASSSKTIVSRSLTINTCGRDLMLHSAAMTSSGRVCHGNVTLMHGTRRQPLQLGHVAPIILSTAGWLHTTELLVDFTPYAESPTPISGEEFASRDDWATLLSVLPQLAKIEVIFGFGAADDSLGIAWGLLDILCYSDAEYKPRVHGAPALNVFCPRLAALVFAAENIDVLAFGPAPEVMVQWPHVWPKLKALMAFREACGARLERVHLRKIRNYAVPDEAELAEVQRSVGQLIIEPLGWKTSSRS
ncbi:hypothetical protein DFH11DRAFT_637888 [Phellopilus nigrolimitatus]|nr:hypothetical protein DFH11DRAFT_637888 [Phellopilus nigrolimitatus]